MSMHILGLERSLLVSVKVANTGQVGNGLGSASSAHDGQPRVAIQRTQDGWNLADTLFWTLALCRRPSFWSVKGLTTGHKEDETDESDRNKKRLTSKGRRLVLVP